MNAAGFQNTYKKPALLFNAHVETIYPALLRKVEVARYTRERIPTPDDDFLDLDWITTNSNKLVVISHGLEGNSERPYVKGMAKSFADNNYDVLAWNYRGCSQQINRQRRFYHSGATDDLECVVQHALTKKYEEIILIGFSLGGNLTLKYLGEATRTHRIRKAIVFSVPMNLYTSCLQLSQGSNWVYSNRFLKSLKKKVIDKAMLRGDIDIKNINAIKTLKDFDDRYTSVLHGYRDAIDYYSQCSSIRFVEAISIPTLIVNAKNDPFLSEDCYPATLLAGHPYVTLETPTFGGHVGFTQFNKKGLFWSEERAVRFVTTHD
jgi:uncharacterized protein